MQRGCALVVLVALLCGALVGAQDGTRGFSIKEGRTFLIPSDADMDKFTLGARAEPLVSLLGRHFAYNCTNGVSDWDRLGFRRCTSPGQSPIDITPAAMAARGQGSAAGRLQANYHPTTMLLSNEYALNLTAWSAGNLARDLTKLGARPVRRNATAAAANTTDAGGVRSLPPPPVARPNATRARGDGEGEEGGQADGAKQPCTLLVAESDEEYAKRTEFTLERVEFHSPAEHLINGVRFALEIQLYHKSKANHTLAVSVMARVAPREHVSPVLATLFTALDDSPFASPVTLNPAVLLPRSEGFWEYTGSLTHPPCSSDVRWMVLQHAVNVTAEFVAVAGALVRDRYHGGNARPVATESNMVQVTAYPPYGPRSLFSLMNSVGVPPTEHQFKHSQDQVRSVSVVDMAREWTEQHPSSGVDGEGEDASGPVLAVDEWDVIRFGKNVGGAVRAPMPEPADSEGQEDNKAVAADAAPHATNNLEGTVHASKYALTGACAATYTWEHRFVPPELVGVQPKDASTMGFPDTPPGSHLIEPRATRSLSTSPVQGVEQFRQPFERIVRVLEE